MAENSKTRRTTKIRAVFFEPLQPYTNVLRCFDMIPQDSSIGATRIKTITATWKKGERVTKKKVAKFIINLKAAMEAEGCTVDSLEVVT